MTDKYEPLNFVNVDQVTSDELKGHVEKWPPDVIKVQFGDETYYYTLTPLGQILRDNKDYCDLCYGTGLVPEITQHCDTVDVPCPDCNGLSYWL